MCFVKKDVKELVPSLGLMSKAKSLLVNRFKIKELEKWKCFARDKQGEMSSDGDTKFSYRMGSVFIFFVFWIS